MKVVGENTVVNVFETQLGTCRAILPFAYSTDRILDFQ